MASILRVNTITDASSNNSIATSFVANGSAKAWIAFSGDGTTVHDSNNISSLVDDGTGIYSYNLTSNMGNTNYASSSSASYINNTSNYETYLSMNYVGNLSDTRTTSQNNVGFWDSSFADPANDACSSILGDLA
jgi:hypothetical protein